MDSTVNNHGRLINMQTHQQWSQLMRVCQLMPDVVFRALLIQSQCYKTGLYQFRILCKPYFAFKTLLWKNRKK